MTALDGVCAARRRCLTVGLIATAVLAVSGAPSSVADATASLKSRVDTGHGAAGCPPYQPDRVLDEVAQRNTAETEAYLTHTARVAPFENSLNKQLMQILHEMGYNATKGYLLVGYGRDEADSIHALLLQGTEYLPDCAYTKYGVNALSSDSQKHVLTAVVLATP